MYKILFSKKAANDFRKIGKSHLYPKTCKMLDELQLNPFEPPYKKLNGKMYGIHLECYAKRINRMHRLVYKVDEKNKVIHVLSFWSHYE